MRSDVLLEVERLATGYRGVQALWDVDLAIKEHETIVLLGANGAGKTTLIKTIMGLLRAWRGAIRFAGEDVTALRTDRRVRRGLVYMSETAGFRSLTIEENIGIGLQFLDGRQRNPRLAELYDIFPALAEKRRALAGSLSGGQRKMLGIAKALAAGPRLLVMDEPSAGLSPLFVKEVIRVLGRFRDQGLTLLIAEQNVKFLDLADRTYTLDGGRIGFAGTVADLRASDAVRQAYFGLRPTAT
jgi:branched-chain amino acid transport system ATP-binding protein